MKEMERHGGSETYSRISEMAAMPTKAYETTLFFLGQNRSEEAN